VPRHPPHRSLSVPFSDTHRPGRSGSHGPAGSWVDLPIPQNSFVWVLLKIGSRARKSAFSHHEPRGEAGAGHRAAQVLGTTQHTNTAILWFVPRPAAALPAPFSYTHRPGRSGRHGPAGSWVDLPIPQNSSVWVLLKNRLASSHTRRRRGRSPRAWESARAHAAAVQRRHGRWASLPTRLPYTPTSLPYTQVAYPTPRPAYPTPRSRGRPTLQRPPATPPKSPTLHPGRLALLLLPTLASPILNYPTESIRYTN
jgi:hypothetical protein